MIQEAERRSSGKKIQLRCCCCKKRWDDKSASNVLLIVPGLSTNAISLFSSSCAYPHRTRGNESFCPRKEYHQLCWCLLNSHNTAPSSCCRNRSNAERVLSGAITAFCT
ncbi:uncharacterized protein WM294_001979 [Sarcoramphus papa]